MASKDGQTHQFVFEPKLPGRLPVLGGALRLAIIKDEQLRTQRMMLEQQGYSIESETTYGQLDRKYRPRRTRMPRGF